MGRRKELSGIFDWLKRLAPPPPVTGAMIPYVSKEPPGQQLPAVRPSTLPAVPRKESRQLSLFDFLEPRKKLPILAKLERAFEFLPPAPTPPPQALVEVPLEKPEETWGEMFKPSEEPAPGQTPDMFEFMKPAARAEVRQFIHPDEWPFGEPPLWQHTRWEMPSTFELADFIQKKWDLRGMYDYVLSQVDSRYWKKEVENSAHSGKPASLDVDLIARAYDPNSDISRFLKIPDKVVGDYANFGPEGLERFSVEVLQPMFERIGKALDVFRPTPELRGWFVLEPDDDMNFWVRYKEVKQYPQLGR